MVSAAARTNQNRSDREDDDESSCAHQFQEKAALTAVVLVHHLPVPHDGVGLRLA
jgi:hypothetical protein